MEFQIFGDPIWFHLGFLPVTETMVTSLIISVTLIVGAALVARYTSKYPASHWATISRISLRWVDENVARIVGRPEPRLTVLAGSLFLFIAACNLAGQLPGVTPPTGSLSTTSALAVIVFLAVPYFGISSQGVRAYVLDYFRPYPVLFPLHVISELSRTLALAFRLFGNIMSGHLLVAILLSLSGFLVPMPFMALDLFIGILQAYIFAVLTIVFVGAALGHSTNTGTPSGKEG